MNILFLGGTRYFGKKAVEKLIENGHNVTVATRGNNIVNAAKNLIVERYDSVSMQKVFAGLHFDVVADSLAYSSNDVKIALDNISCRRYVMTSSAAVYQRNFDLKETDFNPLDDKVIWCSRNDYPYDETKRQAEKALFQCYGGINKAAVRFPYVIGKDDYTKRMEFYVSHIVNQIPINVNNLSEQLSFVFSDDAGKFLAFMCENEYNGAVNGACSETISPAEIIGYIERRSGKRAVLDKNGETAPYNNDKSHSINTDLAQRLGFSFSPLKERLYALIDFYLEQIK